jgi:hypothetical protein
MSKAIEIMVIMTPGLLKWSILQYLTRPALHYNRPSALCITGKR